MLFAQLLKVRGALGKLKIFQLNALKFKKGHAPQAPFFCHLAMPACMVKQAQI